MNARSQNRPLAVTILSLVLIASGIGGLYSHAHHLMSSPTPGNVSLAGVSVLGIVGGAFMLLGSGWARWLAMGWIAFHIYASIYHGWSQVAVHCVVFAVFAVALFHSSSNQYFRSGAVPS